MAGVAQEFRSLESCTLARLPRGPMSSSKNSISTWPTLVASIRQQLAAFDQTAISSEEDFRRALTRLCNQYREREVPRLLNNIRKQHSPIFDLTKSIDSALNLQGSSALTPLVWKTSYLAIWAALAKKKLEDFTGVTKKLNKIVPSLNRENLQRFQEHSKVHTPLQQLFGAYMEVYLTFFSKSAPPVLCLEDFNVNLEDKARFFETRKEEWQRAFEAAQVEEQKRMKDSFGSANGSVQDREPAQPASARFVRLNDLGQGAFGQVYVARQHSTGDLFALKFVSAPNAAQDSGMRKKLKSMVINEVATSKKLQHHHVASVLLWTEETNGFNLVMPTVGDCNLLTFLERCIVAGFPDEQTKLLDNWFGCLATALKFAHANKVIHEDIKPSNILIKDNRVYLADFGCARDYEGRPSSKSPNEHIAGTPVYWPPESEGHRGKGADIFALGCVFSEMLTVRQGRSLADYQAMRKVPDRDNPYAYNKNLDAVQRWLRELSDTRHGLTKLLLEVIVKMLEANVEERLDSRELKMRLPEPLFCGSCL